MDFIRSAAKFLTLAAMGALFSPPALAWWNDDWKFRKEITFDLSSAGANISGSPSDVPVLIRLSLGNFEFFADAKPDGSDFRFIAADDKTPLKHHIERFDATSQMALVWVRLPRLTGGATADKIFLYYGNPDASDGADMAGTFDVNTVLVYHFGAASGSPQDATAYKTEPRAFDAEPNPASLIGAGVRFNGRQAIEVPANQGLQLVPDKGLTLSAWVKLDAPQNDARVISLSDGANRIELGIDGLNAYASLESRGSGISRASAAEPLQTGSWIHLALRAGAGTIQLFVNGNEAARAAAALVPIAGVLTVGAGASRERGFVGELDELQVSNVARPNEWLEAAARSQGMVAPLVVYGGDSQQEGGGEGYLATTLRNVTVDGWVVIVLCIVLLLMSLAIMIGKTILLNRVVKGNAQFLAEFRKLSADPAALDRVANATNPDSDEEDAAFETGRGSQLMSVLTASKHNFGVSTLYRLYHHGVRETNKRLAGQSVGANHVKTLSPASIEAIRATMDASLTRMTQRLSEQMVWLTISISGGPFLGLLGTVIGVMITFASIAASGDVNVNSIAPGIAAALVATVAGLGVAIPCLFGYNYLNTRIKEITADMRVFVDEFVTRVAEAYVS
jgi:biopolymer transport protein ExbB